MVQDITTALGGEKFNFNSKIFSDILYGLDGLLVQFNNSDIVGGFKNLKRMQVSR